jgi:hypothetical protein
MVQLGRQQRDNQSPIHCPFEGHLDVQGRRKDPSKQEGGDPELAMQRKGLRNQLSVPLSPSQCPYSLPQGRSGDKRDTPEAQYTGFVKGLPVLCAHYYSSGYVSHQTTPLQSRKWNLGSKIRWDRGQDRALPAPGSGTWTSMLSAVLRPICTSVAVSALQLPTLVTASTEVSANLELGKAQVPAPIKPRPQAEGRGAGYVHSSALYG